MSATGSRRTDHVRGALARVVRAGVVLASVVLAACSRAAPTKDDGPGLSIAVAPLHLADVTEASWSIVVEAGGQEVWRQSGLLSSRYGDGAGALTYVGPCDASHPEHVVTLTLDRLEVDGALVPPSTYVNPTPVSRPATCRPNADTAVTFDLTLLRDASQGFFDVAVTFDDIFCSAKADCVDDAGDPLLLLHDAHGDRAQTLVMAFACTAGPGQRTHLYMNDVVVRCPGVPDVAVDPGLGPGNVTLAGAPAHVFGAAIYRGKEAFAEVDKCYWNAAVGLVVEALPPRCELVATATAAATPLGDNETPSWSRYPVVAWSIPISDATTPVGKLACGRHGLDAGGGVATDYTPFGPDGVAFRRSLDCRTGEVDAVVLCGNGRLDPGETCDGGAHCAVDCRCAEGWLAAAGGACTRCGDAQVQPGDGEECDGGLGCASCQCPGASLPDGARGCTGCGNGALDPGEGCEAALDGSGHCTACACDAGYPANGAGGCGSCGDGVLQAGEACDPGLGPSCGPACTCTNDYLANGDGTCGSCGDGLVNGAEVCDRLLDESGDCGATTCTCDGGYPADGHGGCLYCGDGVVQSNEQCETVFDDGGQCSATCQCTGGYAPNDGGGCGHCGDGVLNGGEACDGATDPSGHCGDTCACLGGYPAGPGGACAFCGDGVHQPALEACDPELDLELCDSSCICAPGATPTGTGACHEIN